ncbi:MAG: tetrapyrrole methylase family protein / MazG family protein [Eubacteriales bacterium]|nr:tetrapyrrole methylase family protein / MazG family protein [Eubacteriales bacterium]MDN5362949.1 tetrapyrrole methylase family protein / MazG family protein [Eubacteriales bacterium]
MGLGPAGLERLPLANYRLLTEGRPLYLRTAKHPAAEELKQKGVSFTSFDALYEEADSFDQVYRQIVERLLAEAQKNDLIYAVPGHPLVAEESVRLLLAKKPKEIEVEIFSAPSFLDEIYALLSIDPVQGLVVADACSLPGGLNPRLPLLVAQLYNRLLASEVKLHLMNYYPDDHRVLLIRGAGMAEATRKELPLYEVDRQEVDHLTSLYVPPLAEPLDFQRLVEVMAQLRGPDGCPWDREQTHRSLRPYLIEEAAEVLEAIDEDDPDKLCEELGDLLLQIVFHARLAEEAGYFNIADVVAGITEKILRRHPHVFGREEVTSREEVSRNWERIKAAEKKGVDEEESVLGKLPASLSALRWAEKIQERAARVGFDWPDYTGALAKVKEEWEELVAALQQGKREEIEAELGDFLFAVVNLARLLQLDAEGALAQTVFRFRRRFQWMEQEIRRQGLKMEEMSLEELDRFWEKAKKAQLERE